MKYIESRKRSIVKAIGYRIIVSIIAWIMAFWVTDSVEKATTIMTFYYIGAAVIYYIWDRLWQRIDWGKIYEDDRINK